MSSLQITRSPDRRITRFSTLIYAMGPECRLLFVTKVPVPVRHLGETHGLPHYHERMPKRREKRVTMPLTVRLWGLDFYGKVFSQNVKTVNITPGGARVFGVTAKLQPGFTVGLECGRLKGRFVVVWIGEPGTTCEGQIGLRAVDSGIWGVPLPKPAEDYMAMWLEEEFFPEGLKS